MAKQDGGKQKEEKRTGILDIVYLVKQGKTLLKSLF